MLDEARVGIDEWPFGLHQLLGLGERQLVLLHEVGDDQSGTATDTCHAVHQHIGRLEIAVDEVVRRVEEVVDLLFLIVLQIDGQPAKLRWQREILLFAGDAQYSTDLQATHLLDVSWNVDAAKTQPVSVTLRVNYPTRLGD